MVFDRLVPPVNFGMVEQGLYRSGQPSSINLAFLSTLGLKTVVWLAVEEPNEQLLAFADDNDIEIHHMGISEGGNPWDPLTEQLVLDALAIIVQRSRYPLIVQCNMGRHRTGTVIGCLRRLQGWNLASVTEEYRRYAGARRWRVLNELHIEAFKTEDVSLPQEDERPDWLS